jgi:hypothetical protein
LEVQFLLGEIKKKDAEVIGKFLDYIGRNAQVEILLIALPLPIYRAGGKDTQEDIRCLLET